MKVENKAETCLKPNNRAEEKRVHARLTESGRAVYGARSRGGEVCNTPPTLICRRQSARLTADTVLVTLLGKFKTKTELNT